MNDVSPTALLRIGELSRRLGVSDHVLRAWERRYGILRPVRSAGGFRLYSQADYDRVRRMQARLADGLSAAEAARAAIEEERQDRTFLDSTPSARATSANARTDGDRPSDGDRTDGDRFSDGDRPSDDRPGGGLSTATRALATALEGFDEPTADAVLDQLFSTLTVETVLRDVLLPYLREMGDRWERGIISVAQEHFASNIIRARLAGLARGWGHGHGPRAVLACAPGELHDLALLTFGIVLRRNGWRIDYLGANTPLDDVIRVATTRHSDLVALAASVPERFDGLVGRLGRLAQVAPLALAGAGATQALADAVNARLLTADPVTAAERITAPDKVNQP